MSGWKKNVLFGLLAIYLMGCGFAYVLQDEIIFDPHELSDSYRFDMGEEVEIEVEDGISLNTLHVKHQNSDGVLLYFHGNRGDNRRCLHQLSRFANSSKDWIMMDYRGYGKSDGEIESERQLLSDAEAVYNYALQQYDESEITLVGYSLGTGIASHLAATFTPKELVLVAPYVSFYDLKNRYIPIIPNFLVKFPLNNRRNIMKSTCPVTIFHGTSDEVIPFDSAEILANVRDDVSLITLEDTGHRRTIFHRSIRNWFLEN